VNSEFNKQTDCLKSNQYTVVFEICPEERYRFRVSIKSALDPEVPCPLQWL